MGTIKNSKSKLSIVICFVFALLFATSVLGQEKNYYSRVMLQTGNNILANGRKMSKDVYFIKPSYYLYHDKGYYFGAYAIVMPKNAKSKLDNISLNAGYDHDFGDHLTVGIDYTFGEYFSNLQVTSSAAHTLILSSTWFGDVLTPGLFGIWNFGTSTDFTLNVDLSHLFVKKSVWKDGDKLTFPVSVGIYMGTSNYLSVYSKKNRVLDKKGNVIPPTLVPTAFGVTTLYGMAGIKYRISKWSIGMNVMYNVPVYQKIRWAVTTVPVVRISGGYYF